MLNFLKSKKEKKPLKNHIDLSPEEIQPVVDANRDKEIAKARLGQFLAGVEIRKRELFQEFIEASARVDTEAKALCAKHGVPEDDLSYTLHLPQKEGGKAMLIRDGQEGHDAEDQQSTDT